MQAVSKKITYSSDQNSLTIEEQKEAVKLFEQYFKTEFDPEQIPTTEENIIWINKNIPECVNIKKSLFSPHTEVCGLR